MIYGILIFIATLLVDLITDYRIWAKKKTVNHIRGGLLRLIGLIPAFILMGWYSIGLSFVYWVLFDGIFGVLIVRNWFFLGTTGELDKLQHKHPWIILVKYGGAVVGLVFFISNLLKP